MVENHNWTLKTADLNLFYFVVSCGLEVKLKTGPETVLYFITAKSGQHIVLDGYWNSAIVQSHQWHCLMSSDGGSVASHKPLLQVILIMSLPGV